MMQVSLVRVDVEGAVSVVSADSAGGVLRELQAGVGGMVDVVGLPEGIDMWVNDEGMYTESVNAAASLLLGYLGGQPVIWGADGAHRNSRGCQMVCVSPVLISERKIYEHGVRRQAAGQRRPPAAA
ncbi:DUF3846 domain-containing protein [Gordonia sputi]